MRRSLAVVFLLSFGCGPQVEDEEALAECNPREGACTVTLQPGGGADDYWRLGTAETELGDSGFPLEVNGDGDIVAQISRYLALVAGSGSARLCIVGQGFESLDDVSDEPTSCDCDGLEGCWATSVLFGLANGEPDGFVGTGLHVRDSEGRVYRGRVVREDPALDTATLVIEYEGLD